MWNPRSVFNKSVKPLFFLNTTSRVLASSNIRDSSSVGFLQMGKADSGQLGEGRDPIFESLRRVIFVGLAD